MTNSESHVTWREMVKRTQGEVGERTIAQWLCEHASGCDPELALPRLVRSLDNKIVRTHEHDGTTYLLRVVTYLEGVPLSERGHGNTSPALRRDMGRFLARLNRAMQGYFHPAAGHDLLWDVKNTLEIRTHLHHVAEPLHVLDR